MKGSIHKEYHQGDRIISYTQISKQEILPSFSPSLLPSLTHPPYQWIRQLFSEILQFLKIKGTETALKYVHSFPSKYGQTWMSHCLRSQKTEVKVSFFPKKISLVTLSDLLSTNSLHSSLSSCVCWLISGSNTRILFSSSKWNPAGPSAIFCRYMFPATLCGCTSSGWVHRKPSYHDASALFQKKKTFFQLCRVFLQLPERIVFCTLGIILYLAFFWVCVFVSLVLGHLCSGASRRNHFVCQKLCNLLAW